MRRAEEIRKDEDRGKAGGGSEDATRDLARNGQGGSHQGSSKFWVSWGEAIVSWHGAASGNKRQKRAGGNWATRARFLLLHPRFMNLEEADGCAIAGASAALVMAGMADQTNRRLELAVSISSDLSVFSLLLYVSSMRSFVVSLCWTDAAPPLPASLAAAKKSA